MTTQNFETQTKALIDDLKSVCANYGLGNDGNEFKIITQVFLYVKFHKVVPISTCLRYFQI
jgi:type I restriction enzyme M protein